MTDVFSPRKRSEVMRRIRSKDTKPEMLIRRALHRLGFRYRLHDTRLPGRPDIVLPRFRVAIQVRGCFWHTHTCPDGHVPKSRRAYWRTKLAANRARDRENDRKLRQMGWKVIVVWECRLKDGQRFSRTLGSLVRRLEST